MAHSHRHFVPAAGHDLLLPFYDPLQRLMGEERIKRPLIEQAGVRSGQRVLDVGCGTGSLTLLIKRLHRGAEVAGLDPDPKALDLARRKAAHAGLEIEFQQGYGDEMPFPDGSVDRVFSSLMFHHLEGAQKAGMLREIRRVLKPEGSLHLLDFGPPRSRLSRLLTGLVHRGEAVRDNLEGRIPALMQEAGLREPTEVDHRGTIFGGLSYYRASAC
ncbi:MAG: class I SAM-dependent methyltransferase [Myxococcota bacterium]|nr:class I SAM-dependent methyltransferase [Myxococcota bacterium]